MAESILPYALTTLSRVKKRLDFADAVTDWDTILTRMINSATDWVERETGGRRFAMTQYVNEVYSASAPRQKRLTLRQGPVFYLNAYGATTVGSTSITGVSNTSGVVVGMPILGDQIAPLSSVASVSGSTIVLTAAAIATAAQSYFQINGLISFQYRAGTPSTPSWTSYIRDQYEIRNDGRSGIARLYGVFPRMWENMIRATYWAGYLINWANAGDNVTHTLPSDLSDLVENLVVRRFKRRQFAGKTSEALEGAQTSWSKSIDEDDQCVLDHYRRVPGIF